jgi:hypothetical protein
MGYLLSDQTYRDTVAKEAAKTIRLSGEPASEESYLAAAEQLERGLPTGDLGYGPAPGQEAVAHLAETILEAQGLTLETASSDEYLHAVEVAQERLA